MAHPIATASGISAHITVIDGTPTTTTQDIADVYGKRHDDVLRIIRQRMAAVPEEWRLRNFAETVAERANPSGGEPIKSPVIRMTKKGFHFVVGKFTGAKAVQHQIAFADEFERMEAALTSAASLKQVDNKRLQGVGKASAAQVREALNMALAVCAFVQRDVAHAVLAGGDDWMHQRYLISFVTDSKHGNPPMVDRLAPDARVLTPPQIVQAMQSGQFSMPELLDIAVASACALHASARAAPAGWGDEVARKINTDLPMADLHRIATAATTELMLRMPVPVSQLGNAMRKTHRVTGKTKRGSV